MAKRQIKLNGQRSNIAFGVALALAVITLSPAVQAGPQSMLDPYASIQPPTSAKPESRSFLSKKSAKKQVSNAPQAAVSIDENPSYHDRVAKKPSKLQAPKAVASEPIDKPASSSLSANPGFFTGLKEIQHGYVTSIKAAGQGIVSGGKAAGSKMAAAGQKVVALPKAFTGKTSTPKQPAQVATNPLPTKYDAKSLPGKPLDQIPKHVALKGKDKALEGEDNGNILSHTFSKLNFFNKNKIKVQPANITANNPNTLPQ